MHTVSKATFLLLINLAAIHVHASEIATQLEGSGFEPPVMKPESAKWGGRYPGKAVHSNRSGAVELHFMVEPNGKPSNFIIGSYTDEMFVKQAEKALKKHRYTPAMMNGKPVASRVSRVFSFSGRFKNSKVIDRFNEHYEQFSNEFLKPEPSQELLLEHLGLIKRVRQPNPTAQGIITYAQMIYAEKFLSLEDKLDAARVADIYRLGGLSVPRKVEIKRKLISWMVEARRYGDAARLINSLKPSDFVPKLITSKDIGLEAMMMQVRYLEEYKASHSQVLNLVNLKSGPFAETLMELEQVKASREPFANSVLIGDSGYELRWLLGNRFTFDQVKGQIDELAFQCDAKFHRMEFVLGQDYELPESWGKCLIQINGASGTRARFIEG